MECGTGPDNPSSSREWVILFLCQQQAFISPWDTYHLMSKQSLVLFTLLKYLPASFHSQRTGSFCLAPSAFCLLHTFSSLWKLQNFYPATLSQTISYFIKQKQYDNVPLPTLQCLSASFLSSPLFFAFLPFFLAFMFFFHFNFYFILAYSWFGLPRWHSGQESAC